ncbi:hypothetical protein JCM12298_20580 [Desulfothermus naphthae]
MHEIKVNKVFLNCILLLLFLMFSLPCFTQSTGFPQEDRERLIRLEATLKVFMEQIDKRFEQVDERFEVIINFLWMLNDKGCMETL